MAEEYGTPGGEESGMERVKDKARELKDEAESKAEELSAKAQERSEEVVQEGKEKARELGDEASRAARSRAEEQKARVAGGLHTLADALRHGTDGLPEDQRQYGGFLETVADRVDNASRYLEQRDVDGLTREARTFAREHTPLFLGGAFALGVAGARFLKSSGSEAGERSRARPEHPSTERTAGTVPMQEPGSRLGGSPSPYDTAGRRAEPTRPYPRSSSVRQATDRIQEEGGHE